MVTNKILKLEKSSQLVSLTKQIKAMLSLKRWQHSLNTARLAFRLADRSPLKYRAYLAGILHDCGRELSDKQVKTIFKKYNSRYLDSNILEIKELWHNITSSYLARYKFGIKDTGILRAIARHSVGGTGMLRLDKIIYVADFCEPGRKHLLAREVRKLAIKDIEQAVDKVSQAKIIYLKKKRVKIHPQALALARIYKQK